MNSNGNTPTAVDWATMPDWIDVREAAEKAGYHPDHLRRLIRHGTIKATKRGTMWWVDKASLLQYMATVEELGTKKHAGIPHEQQQG